jgi:KaiA C-terminal domain
MDGHKQRERQSLFSQMSLNRDREFRQQLKADYCQLLLLYFTNDTTVKQQIDRFIQVVFDAKVPVPQIIEIHMELIDEFSKQLKLEGRNDDVLLDYRLTLIDVLAHLCEVYRTSVS